jgi:acetyltransferase-like isoleucine patch superfamily enzyme
MKQTLKGAANILAVIFVLPCLLLFWLGNLAVGRQQAFAGWSQALSLIPGHSGIYVRRAFYRFVFPFCAPDVCLCFGTVFSHPTAEVGRNVYVGLYCCIGDVSLGDDVLIGSHVSVMNGGAQHGIDRIDIPIREQPGRWPRITIGRDSWIGDRAVVLADVGNHCVIGAGAVVCSPIPDYAIALGVPARIVRYRNTASVSQSRMSCSP